MFVWDCKSTNSSGTRLPKGYEEAADGCPSARTSHPQIFRLTPLSLCKLYIKCWLLPATLLEIYIEEKKMNISEVEPKFAQKLVDTLRDILQDLNYTLPEHYQPRVSLLDASGRKKKSNAAANNWSPESGRIEIRFEATQPENKHKSAGISLKVKATLGETSSPELDFRPIEIHGEPLSATVLRERR